MAIELPCSAWGCDQKGRACLLVPAGMPDVQVRIWAHARQARERGIELVAYCEFHQGLIREDKLEVIGHDGERLRLYDD